jgi:hypothetical protein
LRVKARLEGERNVGAGRPLCANSGHSATAWRTYQTDPKTTFRFDAMDGWEAREIGSG